MATVDSNADEIESLLDRLIGGFDFTRPGKDQSLGRDLAGVVASGIIARSVPGCRAPDGSTWDPNEDDDYIAWKRARYGADQVGLRTGQMLSLESMMGETAVEPDRVVMRYGTGKAPSSARNGAALSKGDLTVTDRAKATYFALSGREFYGLDPPISLAMDPVIAEALSRYLKG